MKNIFSKFVLAAFLFSSVVGTAVARECTTCKRNTAKKAQVQSKAAVCKRAQSTAELNVNNVRALINGYGNMWYDGSLAQYHIPKNGTSTPLFCAALWIGGTDVNDQLRIAALRFGSEGDDYWPGPLTVDNKADITLDVCNKYDKHFKITQAEVQAFMAMFDYTPNGAVQNANYDDAAISQSIKDWPAHGEGNQSHYLAPFYDADGDGEYNYTAGDYPYYDFDNALCPRTLKASLAPGENYSPRRTMEDSAGIVSGGLLSDQVLKGDQTIWWVFNDMGNTHTESQGQAIGLEIRAQAFAFSTNNEINDMTFYSYEIINRSTYELRNTYFSQWVDADLGYAGDDFIGCDVKRGLGYCYNGDEEDGPGTGKYSGIPPAVGIDFFQGPYMDPDGKDNPKIDIDKMRIRFPEQLEEYKLPGGGYDTIKLTDDADLYYPDAWYFTPGDAVGNCAINGVNFGNNIIDDERFGMRRFVYYENSTSAINGEPTKAVHYYRYLQGFWLNGSRMKYGGNAISSGTTELDCDFMFPGDSDPLHWGTDGIVPSINPNDWTEVTSGANVTPGDRRFMQSAGPFTLKPGALNYITVGIPFAQATSGSAWSSVELLREIDDVCQSLFENCFKVLDGPDAPTVIVQELNNEVILYLTYEQPSSNNYGEKYSEEDPSIVRSYTDANGVSHAYSVDERSYKFEGYQIFQLKDANTSIADIYDETKSRLVAQCDIENYYDDAKTVPIGTLVNFTSNSTTGLLTGNIKVTGANAGIQHAFRITTDQFASGTNTNLVNNKEYYFIAIAYAHNRFKEYSQTNAANLDGQKEPYLAGRKNERGGTISAVTAIPHDPATENGGTIIQAEYGLSPNITRIEGYGNGGRALELTEESIQELMGAPGQEGKAPGVFKESVSGGVYGNAYMQNPCVLAHPRYKQNAGPINVQVIDPLNVKPGKFYISFDTIGNDAKWVISKVDGTPLYDSVYTDTADFVIGRYNEQLFLDLGIMVSLSNPTIVASEILPEVINGQNMVSGGIVNEGVVLSSSMKFSDSTKHWLSGIPDNDNSITYDWIHSGTQYADGNRRSFIGKTTPYSNNEAYVDEDYYRLGYDESNRPIYTAIDKYQEFENVVGGLWGPYGLSSTLEFHPGFNFRYYMADSTTLDSVIRTLNPSGVVRYNQSIRRSMNHTANKSLIYNDFSKLPSVRVVITSDTTKWTRCPVLEMCDDYTQSEGNARRFQKRRHLSVDKQGRTITDRGISANTDDPNNPAYISAEGMGWFPGYAINLETGERLNMLFGEDSRYVQYNGRDMMWNPVSNTMDGTQNYVLGGRHYIYIMNAMTQRFPRYHQFTTQSSLADYVSPSYDAGRWASKMLGSLDRVAKGFLKKDASGKPAGINGLLYAESNLPIQPTRDSAAFFFSTVAWCNMPLVNSRFSFTNPMDIPCDVTININVNSQYGMNMSDNGTKPQHCGIDTNSYNYNHNRPLYMFELTEDIATLTGQATAENAAQTYKDSILSMINVVPNPYYSSSAYETSSQLETKVRFINVPAGSTISIYTVDGTLVRRFGPTPNNATTYDWDLHNHNGIPIGGGIYLVHFNCPGIGERVVKWFGTMRPVDLNSFNF